MTNWGGTTGTTCPYQRTGHSPEPGIQRLEALTDREREVLLLLGTGVGNRELSRELGIAERTVKAHISNIVAKLGQQTRTQVAIVSALAHNALCDEPSCSRHLAPTSGRRQKSTIA
ncbi:response regulator transcription factor [Streptomyces sp. NEAU-sy36]|uniref:LuxR C-terminal-related transcriptional regulator n=1 Tax=unclassified Streptomyces TaxID=2593676 RepID=UPI0015D65BF0|nr:MULTISPECIES: LuxR C-terminal-related transcriptional regulator [unclassified Streptomyces]QLJ02933.1 response regulator transcription factor [Streptomyces sp. NEAU-sy36]